MENSKINLLIVDDEIQFLNAISRSLELREFKVTAVDSGEKAIEAARTQPIDIALVDLKMPGMSGEKVLKALKKEHKWMEIVILTGHGTIDSAAACTRDGAYSYLQKPCNLEALLETLTRAYRQKVMNKRKLDDERMNAMLKLSMGHEALGILRQLKKIDREGA